MKLTTAYSRFAHLTRNGSVLAVLLCVISHACAAQLQVFPRHVPAAATRRPAGQLDRSLRLNLALGLPLRNAEALTNLLQQLYQPSSARFRHYLTAAQFAASFGPTEQDYQAIKDFASAHGLKITGAHANRTILDVNGTVAEIEETFHVHLRLYPHPAEARFFFAPDAAPSVELDTRLLAVSGLDNYIVPRPKLRHGKRAIVPFSRPLSGSAGGGAYMGDDFRAAYVPGVSLTGAGQAVGLFELDGYNPSDIAAYETQAGIASVPLTNILIDGFDGSATLQDGDDEVCLDIEVTAAMAPGLSRVLVYEGPPSAPGETVYTPPIDITEVNDVLNRMATDNLANQLSCSWAFDINATTQQIFKQYAAQGQSFFAASGDSGAYAGAVDEPADDPYITVVGGTILSTTGPAGAWVSETTWNTGDSLVGAPCSGGGISLTYPIPVWQQGISMTANQGSTALRNTPDVAMVADDVWVVFNGHGQTLEGTSASTPLWAAFMALVNEQAAASGLAPIGFANPALYASGRSSNYAACFHDITTGSNTSRASPNKFYAVPGYDLCTGWGTPAGSNLIQALLQPPAESLLISPPFGFTASGPVGGPFQATSQSYVLTNLGTAPLQWSLLNTSSWLTVFSTNSGTLNPGDPAAVVTISLNSAASNLLLGSFIGNVSMSNLTDGTVQNRAFFLLPGNAGFETGDFSDWTYSGDTNETFVLAADDASIDGLAASPSVADWQLVHSGLYAALFGESGSLAQISQTLPTTAGQSYLVSFWLTSVAGAGTANASEFIATWGGGTLLADTNLGAFGWTNEQFVVSAVGTNTILAFGARDDSAAMALDDVSVQPISAPSVSATQTAGTLTLTWNSLAGLVYQVQETDSLSPANWADLGDPITAAGNSTMTVENLSDPAEQFFRVVLLE